MKLNNKGFAITSIIYSMLILFLTLVVLIIGNLASRKAVFDKQKEDILGKLEQNNSSLKEYQQVEYIQSDGGSWIDTGFKANQDTRVVVDFQYVNIANSFLFGCRTTYNENSFTVNIGNNATEAVTSYNISGNYQYDVPDTLRHQIDKNKNKFQLVDKEINVTFPIKTFECPGTLEIFASYDASKGAGYLPSATKLYSFQIYDNDKLIRNFIPCYRTSDNEVGLYDLIEGKFYTNAGSGKLEIGPEI